MPFFSNGEVKMTSSSSKSDQRKSLSSMTMNLSLKTSSNYSAFHRTRHHAVGQEVVPTSITRLGRSRKSSFILRSRMCCRVHLKRSFQLLMFCQRAISLLLLKFLLNTIPTALPGDGLILRGTLRHMLLAEFKRSLIRARRLLVPGLRLVDLLCLTTK
jgi:hypothetical protein